MDASDNPLLVNYTSLDDYLFPLNVLEDELKCTDIKVCISIQVPSDDIFEVSEMFYFIGLYSKT